MLAGLDRGVAEAYKAALQRLGPDRTSREALVGEQRLFLEAREAAYERSASDLARFLKDRREFLNSILPPRDGYEGTWRNGFGDVTIARRPDGTFRVSAGGGEWVTANWVCEYEGAGTLVDGALAVKPSDPDLGWGLTAVRQGGVLKLEEKPRNDRSGQPPYCGNRGSMEGAYFRATPIRQQD
jgi:hypothetical protein